MIEQEPSGIVLCGMMGVGKSDTGRAIVDLLKMDQKTDFVDTDDLITGFWGYTAAQIIAGDMEGVHPGIDFQQAQREAIFDYSPEGHEIIATGGNVGLHLDLMTHLSLAGTVVQLRAPASLVLTREGMVERSGSLAQANGMTYEEVAAQRDPIYAENLTMLGGLAVDVASGDTAIEVAQRTIDVVSQYRLAS